jgi:hypothetical protein
MRDGLVGKCGKVVSRCAPYSDVVFGAEFRRYLQIGGRSVSALWSSGHDLEILQAMSKQSSRFDPETVQVATCDLNSPCWK